MGGRSQGPSGGELAGLGIALALSFVIPLLAGLGLDAALKTGPVFLLVGVLVGIGAAIATAFVRFQRYF